MHVCVTSKWPRGGQPAVQQPVQIQHWLWMVCRLQAQPCNPDYQSRSTRDVDQPVPFTCRTYASGQSLQRSISLSPALSLACWRSECSCSRSHPIMQTSSTFSHTGLKFWRFLAASNKRPENKVLTGANLDRVCSWVDPN
jgi:hypothetical protein